jgi:hypothetical protein
MRAGKRWAGGIDRKEVDEDFADDFVRQRQDRVLVGIESLLNDRSLISQHGKRALEILDLRIEIHDASTVCGKRVDHGDWE